MRRVGLLLFLMLVLMWLLLQWGVLPPSVAMFFHPIVTLAWSLAFPLFILSLYLAPGLYRDLHDDLRHGWQRLRTRRYEVEDLQRKIAHLDRPYHMVQLGSVYAAQGRPARAVEWFQRALEKDPTLLEAQYKLASSLFDQGQYSQAAELLEKVHAVKPDYDYGMAYLRLAEAHQRLGNTQRASEIFETLLRFYPGHPEALYHFALLLAGQNGSDRATQLMRDAVLSVRLSPGFQRRRNRHWALKAQWWLFRH